MTKQVKQFYSKRSRKRCHGTTGLGNLFHIISTTVLGVRGFWKYTLILVSVQV